MRTEQTEHFLAFFLLARIFMVAPWRPLTQCI
jgi:hypothetical protein